MLPRKNRLPKKDITKLFAFGEYATRQHFTVIIKPNRIGVSRFGFLMSAKVAKKTTVRNLLRRRLMGLIQPHLKISTIKSVDIMIRPAKVTFMLSPRRLAERFREEIEPFLE